MGTDMHTIGARGQQSFFRGECRYGRRRAAASGRAPRSQAYRPSRYRRRRRRRRTGLSLVKCLLPSTSFALTLWVCTQEQIV